MNDKTETLDFLFELGTEELPPLALRSLSEALGHNVKSGLAKANLQHGELKIYATPRRLAVLIRDLMTRQANRHLEKRGPALTIAFDNSGAYTAQARGFARSCGIEVEQLEKLTTDKGAWLIFRKQELGRATRELLPSIINQALNELPIPKRMRWGALKVEFVRPVHWAVMLFGDQIIDAEILGQKTGQMTHGHRFHHPEPLMIANPAVYETVLATQGYVLVDFNQRRATIREQVQAAAHAINGQAVWDESLLDEVTSLVEWPVPVTGNFEARFLEVPREALISTMQSKQKYFPVIDHQDQLLPHFITISNIASRDLTCVREGNERVIRPRLEDAAFFWQQDRRHSLFARLERLKEMLFHERLGSLYDKSLRLSQLSVTIATLLNHDANYAARAGLLAKCDLLTDMVNEFPELQGIIGRYYAAHDGETSAVAAALAEQYLPRFAGDQLPITATGQILALADRLDTLIGIFGIGLPPTGDKDPFALKRAALGALRIIIENQLPLALINLLQQTLINFQQIAQQQFNQKNVVEQVYAFMMERLRAYFLEQNFQADEFEAVMARNPSQPLDIKTRIQAVHNFRKLNEAASLIAANKRIKNILRQTQEAIPEIVAETLLIEPAEQQLQHNFAVLETAIINCWEAHDYYGVLHKLATLKNAIDQFFDAVMVMTDNAAIRKNRLCLLKKIFDYFLRIADISLLRE